MGYMAPEMNSGPIIVGPEVDLWSFGVCLYEMAVAYKPTNVQNYRYGNNNFNLTDLLTFSL